MDHSYDVIESSCSLIVHGQSMPFEHRPSRGMLNPRIMQVSITPHLPPPPGTCFNFHSGRGGDPSPLSSSAPENLCFGNIF